MTSYAESGVDIELGDEASKVLFEASRATFDNRKGLLGEVLVPTKEFSGMRAIDVSRLPEGTLMGIGFDGVGTKVEIAQRMEDHTSIAYDLLAMVCDDAVVRGAEPVLVGTVLDTCSLKGNIQALKQLAKGYIGAAKDAGVAIVNGEIAELQDAVGGYGDFRYNWCAGLVWFASKKRLLTGQEIEIGDSIVVFQEKGFRSNGMSLVRKVFSEKIGKDWHLKEYKKKRLGELVLQPSQIYSKAVVAMNGGFHNQGSCMIHGVAHITGGGIPGKLGRILKVKGLGAELTDLFEPCDAMKYCMELGVEEDEAYRTWNMGQGMLIVTPEPEKVVREAAGFGIKAKLAGVVTEKGITINGRKY